MIFLFVDHVEFLQHFRAVDGEETHVDKIDAYFGERFLQGIRPFCKIEQILSVQIQIDAFFLSVICIFSLLDDRKMGGSALFFLGKMHVVRKLPTRCENDIARKALEAPFLDSYVLGE